MGQAIRVTVTMVYEYTPDLGDSEYIAEGITDIQDALELDRKDYDQKKISLGELVYNPPTETAALWEIVEDQL